MIHTSYYWRAHFEVNQTRQRIDWSVKPSISEEEKKKILYSLKAWQLGETSDGHNLLAAATKYSFVVGDPGYREAIRLFIKEEQKHGANLGNYIDRIGESRLKKDWGDSLFRKVRHLNSSMELWTITVIIVEAAAQVFYKSLHDATGCRLLKSICMDILVDEAHHIKFQNERMYVIFQRKCFYNKAISLLFYSVLFFITIHAVWFGHKKAFKAGGISMNSFMKQMYCKFFRSMIFLHSYQEERNGIKSSALSFRTIDP